MAKRKRKKARKDISSPSTPDLVFMEYDITSKPIIDAQYQRLPEPVKASIERLHTLSQTKPRQAIPELEDLLLIYPNLPMLYNYLSVAYASAGENEKAEEVIKANYERNPDYLFARLNYAEICLMRHDYPAVAEIFDHKFDLKLLYPKRNRFHVTEAAGFMGIMGVYFLATGQRSLAENLYQVLMQIQPDHPYTRRLKQQLYPGFFQRLLQQARSHSSDQVEGKG